jgi:hypothetical protein
MALTLAAQLRSGCEEQVHLSPLPPASSRRWRCQRAASDALHYEFQEVGVPCRWRGKAVLTAERSKVALRTEGRWIDFVSGSVSALHSGISLLCLVPTPCPPPKCRPCLHHGGTCSSAGRPEDKRCRGSTRRAAAAVSSAASEWLGEAPSLRT